MTDSRPWYRQFWPWLLIAIPLLGVILSSITAFNAVRGADTEVRGEFPPLSKTSGAQTGADDGQLRDE